MLSLLLPFKNPQSRRILLYLSPKHYNITTTKHISRMENRYILYDCDTGSDDAIAMMMLLKATTDKSVQTVGITCVGGNTSLENVVINNLRLLKLYNLLDEVPVYKGCHEALVEQTCPSAKNTSSIHGSDGMGGVPDLAPKRSNDLLKYVKRDHAAKAIVNLAEEYREQLTIVATGPLTNLAVALKFDRDLPKKVKNLYIMGGTREGHGNVTPAAEFNFHVDPEAAFVVLRAFPPLCPTHLVDYGYTTRFPLSLDWVNEWIGQHRNKREEFASAILKPLIDWHVDRNENELVICDAYAMGMALDDNIASSPSDNDVCIELSGNISRGHVVWNKTGTKHTNFYGPVTLYEGFDMEKYKNMLIRCVV